MKRRRFRPTPLALALAQAYGVIRQRVLAPVAYRILKQEERRG